MKSSLTGPVSEVQLVTGLWPIHFTFLFFGMGCLPEIFRKRPAYEELCIGSVGLTMRTMLAKLKCEILDDHLSIQDVGHRPAQITPNR